MCLFIPSAERSYMENDTDFLLVAMRSREVAIYFYLLEIFRGMEVKVSESLPSLWSNKTCTNSQQTRSEKIIKQISRIKFNWCSSVKSSWKGGDFHYKPTPTLIEKVGIRNPSLSPYISPSLCNFSAPLSFIQVQLKAGEPPASCKNSSTPQLSSPSGWPGGPPCHTWDTGLGPGAAWAILR